MSTDTMTKEIIMHRKQVMKVAAILMMVVIPLVSNAGPREMAKRIHDRLAGVPPTEAVLDAMEACINDRNSAGCTAGGGNPALSNDGAVVAAYIAMNNASFYNVTLKNFAAPWTNEAQSRFVPLNDYTATVIGMIRDDVDFRGILSADILYVGGTTTPAYSNSSNAHYLAMENSGADLNTELVQRLQSAVTGMATANTAGAVTTRAAARAFFIDGTSRAMFRFTLINHLCTDIEPLKDNTRPADRIRQDVSRSPGGDSRIYMNSCIGCHAGMDPLMQAYAYYDWNYPANQPDNGQLVFDSTSRAVDPNDASKGTTRARPKFLINASNFPYGYVTRDNSWTNYWRNGPNAILGWSGGPSSGQGAKSMGQELANSSAFASCQVRKVFKTVCLRDPMDSAADRTRINSIVASFGGGAINMKRVFGETASYCKDGSKY